MAGLLFITASKSKGGAPMIIGIARASILMAKADQIYERLHSILEHLIQTLDSPAFDPVKAHTELSNTLEQFKTLPPNGPYPWPIPLKVFDLIKTLPDDVVTRMMLIEAMKEVYKCHLEALKSCASNMRVLRGGEIEWN